MNHAHTCSGSTQAGYIRCAPLRRVLFNNARQDSCLTNSIPRQKCRFCEGVGDLTLSLTTGDRYIEIVEGKTGLRRAVRGPFLGGRRNRQVKPIKISRLEEALLELP